MASSNLFKNNTIFIIIILALAFVVVHRNQGGKIGKTIQFNSNNKNYKR